MHLPLSHTEPRISFETPVSTCKVLTAVRSCMFLVSWSAYRGPGTARPRGIIMSTQQPQILGSGNVPRCDAIRSPSFTRASRLPVSTFSSTDHDFTPPREAPHHPQEGHHCTHLTSPSLPTHHTIKHTHARTPLHRSEVRRVYQRKPA